MPENVRHILILREISDAEWKEIEQMKNVQILSTVYRNKSGVHHIELNPEEQKKAVHDFFDVMLAAGANHSAEKEKLNRALTIDNIAYWYYLRFSFFVGRYPKYVEEENIKRIIALYPSNNFVIYSQFSHSIPAEYITVNAPSISNIRWLLSFMFVFLFRAFLGFFLHFKSKKNRHLILLEPYNQQKLLDINETGKIILGDYYNEYLTDYASKLDDFAFMSDFYIPKHGDNIKIHNRLFFNKYTKKSFYFEAYFLSYLLNPLHIIKLFSFRKKLIRQISTLNPADFQEYTIPFVKSKVNLLTLMYAREQTIYRWIKKNKIRSITCHHEQAYHHYSFVMAARKAGVVSIGFQHGVIHPYHPHYIFVEDDKKYHPYPDYMIAWGEHWRDFLIKHSTYSPEKVITLGQVRTDIIDKLPKGIENNKQFTVLYASQHNPRADFRSQLTTDIFNTLKQFDNIKLIIKPHPGEKDAMVHFTEKADSLGYHNWEISHDDLFKMLNSCDLLLTYSSTVASEAIYFKKPVFIYDPEDADVSGYKQYVGAVFTNNSPEKLYENFDIFVNGRLKTDSAVQNAFIEKFAYKIDGKTSERYIEFIRKQK